MVQNEEGPDLVQLNIPENRTENELQRIIETATFKMKQRERSLVLRYRKRDQETLVSVVMPTWNRKFIIGKAIDSVMSQTYRNFELIVSDDGSTDGTGPFISEKYGTDRRVRLIGNEHRGATYARNSALEKAHGHLVAYLDSDNQWCPDYLLIMVNSLKDFPAYSCAYCGIRIIDTIRRTRLTRLVDYDRKSLVNRNFIDMNVFMHHRDLYDRYGGFNHNVPPLEDWELILRYTLEYPPLLVRCCLVHYHIAKNLDHHSLTMDVESSYHRIRDMYPQ